MPRSELRPATRRRMAGRWHAPPNLLLGVLRAARSVSVLVQPADCFQGGPYLRTLAAQRFGHGLKVLFAFDGQPNLDDAAIGASAGWRRMSSSAAFRRTLSVASARSAVLRLDRAHFRRLALVVRTCPSCGRIGVYHGGVLWRTLSTRSSSVHNRVLITLPDIGLRTTTIRLRPAGGHPVYVDGVAVMPV